MTNTVSPLANLRVRYLGNSNGRIGPGGGGCCRAAGVAGGVCFGCCAHRLVPKVTPRLNTRSVFVCHAVAVLIRSVSPFSSCSGVKLNSKPLFLSGGHPHAGFVFRGQVFLTHPLHVSGSHFLIALQLRVV